MLFSHLKNLDGLKRMLCLVMNLFPVQITGTISVPNGTTSGAMLVMFLTTLWTPVFSPKKKVCVQSTKILFFLKDEFLMVGRSDNLVYGGRDNLAKIVYFA